MYIGGSTTALISLLHSLDKHQYEIDLILYENRGPLMSSLPTGINILPQAKSRTTFNLLTFFLDIKLWKAIFYKYIKRQKGPAMQLISQCRLHFSRKIKKNYDIIVGFLECWPTYYIASSRVNGKKRIAWIHTDYKAAGFKSSIDSRYFSQINNLIVVSNAGLISLKGLFPHLSQRMQTIENLVVKDFLVNMSLKEKVSYKSIGLAFVVVCRMDIYVKGLDRLLEIFKRLDQEKYSFSCHFIGNDESGAFQSLLARYSFQNQIKFLGPSLNPYPYIKAADVCLLLSRFEGKPIVVTESLLLGIPVIVTNYKSALEQVKHNFFGLVANNDSEDIYNTLKKVLNNRDLVEKMKSNLLTYPEINNISSLDRINLLFSNKG